MTRIHVCCSCGNILCEEALTRAADEVFCTSCTEPVFSIDAGHFLATAIELGNTVEEKNAAYGSSFERSGEILRILYPNGVPPNQYQDMLAITRVLDKLFRIATAKDALGESPWRDLAGYGILMSAVAPAAGSGSAALSAPAAEEREK